MKKLKKFNDLPLTDDGFIKVLTKNKSATLTT
jgi:hypothetical protein